MKTQWKVALLAGIIWLISVPSFAHAKRETATRPESQKSQIPAQVVATTQNSSPIIRGVVPARFHRPIQPAAKPKMSGLLKRFECPAMDFPYKKRMMRDEKAFSVWLVNFPSPFRSADPCNNVVWGEYFRSKVKGLRPAVIVLHPLDSRVTFMRFICEKLASEGMDSIWIRMAYYGERASQGFISQLMLMQDTNSLVTAVCQTVMDIRRTTEFLSSQPDVDAKRIYLCGGSLGAIVGSLVIGVDGGYPKAAFVVGGGNLARIFTENESAIRTIRMVSRAKELTAEDISREFRPIEPLTYADRCENTDVLMINAKNDTIIPPASSRELAGRLKHVKQEWYDCGHEIHDWDKVISEILAFFKK